MPRHGGTQPRPAAIFGIWVSLTQAHKELYREIQTVQLGGSAALEQHFGEARMTVRGPAHS